MHYLYRIINQLNNKIYIGQTKHQKNRWMAHKSYAKHPERTKQYIHSAMAKYGADNFVYEIIATCQTQEDANEIESLLIAQYDSRNNKFGYNVKPGGLSAGHSEETKQKLSKSFTKYIQENGHPCQGQIRTPEQCAKMSVAQQHRNNNYTPEMRLQMSLSHIGQKHPAEVVEKRKASLKLTNDAKIAEKLQSGELKCNAPGCKIIGIYRDYLIINDIRYCAKHGSRIKRNGTLETKPAFKYSESNPMPEDVRKKCGIANIGKKAHNRHEFTKEEIYSILNDKKPIAKIAREFDVTDKVILRVRRENKL